MKKKILALCVCVAMLATALVGGTLAYFTDTQEQTNTFTAGHIGIKLDESVVEEAKNGDIVAVADGSRTPEDQTYKLYPAQTVTKDPKITLVGDSEDAFVAAVVNVTGDIHGLIGVEGYDNIDITKLASGGLMSKTATQVTGWNGLSMVYETEDCVIYQVPNKADNEWTLYVFMKDAMKADEEVVLFSTLTIPDEWDNDEMNRINGMKIDIDAYAVQAKGFDYLDNETGAVEGIGCLTAMKAAFGKDATAPFNFLPVIVE